MSEQDSGLVDPDLADGIAPSELAEGVPLLGHAHGEAVLLARRRDEIFAVGAFCTHYGAPLSTGCSSKTPSAAHGITPASACAAEKRCVRRR